MGKDVNKRPAVLPATMLKFKNEKENWIAFIGLKDGKPYEIFTGLYDTEEGIYIPESAHDFQIEKKKDDSGQQAYILHYKSKGGRSTSIEGLNIAYNPEFWNYGTMIAGCLRYNMPVEEVIKLLQKFKGEKFDTINNWKNGVVRALKKFVKDGTKSQGQLCESCGNESMVYQEGCLHCMTCGYSRCG